MEYEHIDTKRRISLMHGTGVITEVMTIPSLNPSSATPFAPQDWEEERIIMIKFDILYARMRSEELEYHAPTKIIKAAQHDTAASSGTERCTGALDGRGEAEYYN